MSDVTGCSPPPTPVYPSSSLRSQNVCSRTFSSIRPCVSIRTQALMPAQATNFSHPLRSIVRSLVFDGSSHWVRSPVSAGATVRSESFSPSFLFLSLALPSLPCRYARTSCATYFRRVRRRVGGRPGMGALAISSPLITHLPRINAPVSCRRNHVIVVPDRLYPNCSQNSLVQPRFSAVSISPSPTCRPTVRGCLSFEPLLARAA